MAFLNHHKALLLIALVFAGCAGVVFAQPYYLNDQLKPDPYRKAGEVTCLACHQDESGGGLIEFGEAFQREGAEITPLLRTQFPNMFTYPVAKIGDVSIHFSDPENKKIIIETAGKKIVVDVEKRTSKEAAAAGATPMTSVGQEKGRVLTERVCTACHAMDAQTAGGRTPDAWKRVVEEMIAMGASATDEEAKIIVDYLSHIYPPKN